MERLSVIGNLQQNRYGMTPDPWVKAFRTYAEIRAFGDGLGCTFSFIRRMQGANYRLGFRSIGVRVAFYGRMRSFAHATTGHELVMGCDACFKSIYFHGIY